MSLDSRGGSQRRLVRCCSGGESESGLLPLVGSPSSQRSGSSRGEALTVPGAESSLVPGSILGVCRALASS